MSGVHASNTVGPELPTPPAAPDTQPCDSLGAGSGPPPVRLAAALVPTPAVDVDGGSAMPAGAVATGPDDAVAGLRTAQQDHLPELPLAALRWARANDPDFPPSVDKRGAELLYRVGDLKRWARNRPRAATGTMDLD